jgi:leucyl-tRNA synthetase
MGKSLKNSVAPDEVAEGFGADTLRVYEMSMGPLDASRPWATKDVVGAQRFLQRVWRLVVDEESGAVRVSGSAPSQNTLRVLNKTIAGVHEDYVAMRDNTAAAKLIELTNHLTKEYPAGAPQAAAEALVLMLAPLAPHIAEELWSRLGHGESLAKGPFPVAEEKWLVDESVEYPIQVNGKLRSKVSVPADASREAVQEVALADEKIVALLEGKAPRKVIVVPGKMVNIVL